MNYLTTITLMTLFNLSAMAKEIKTEILIHATPEKVWLILTNFDDYPNWNPFITSIKGDLKVGNKITIKIKPTGSKGMTFKPKIRRLETNKALSWMGHFLFAGLFDGEHKFELIDNRNGTTTFKQSETFKGLLVWMFNLENTKKGFEQMNKELKLRAEKH